MRANMDGPFENERVHCVAKKVNWLFQVRAVSRAVIQRSAGPGRIFIKSSARRMAAPVSTKRLPLSSPLMMSPATSSAVVAVKL